MMKFWFGRGRSHFLFGQLLSRYFAIRYSLFSVHYFFECRTQNIEWWSFGLAGAVPIFCLVNYFPATSLFGTHYSVFIISLNIEHRTSNDEVLVWQGPFPFFVWSTTFPLLRYSVFIIQCSLFLWTSNAEHRMMNDEVLVWQGPFPFFCLVNYFPATSLFGIHYSVFIISLNIERWTSNDEWWSFGLAGAVPILNHGFWNFCTSEFYIHNSVFIISFFLHFFHHSKNSPIIRFASSHPSLRMQYFIFGGLNSPWISPASFSSLKCCDSVLRAIGKSCAISPL